ncbi:YueI family protein [Bacillus sp. UMB0893]|uniref:YueI family protein n=1 Tax=Bacillus sp. UMB0893 TaxID=2066053 RepID=UPI000C777E6A|nr:YueI family protein [Bacillus sp. UMB0893]PLR67038.1 DUF1694 domain-containing protein [Bacillus sp. UMB0893]
MSEDQLDLYLKQGMYGTFETKPEERSVFLGTIRERIIIALTKGQVRQQKVYDEVKSALKSAPKKNLLLNGTVDYSSLSKYIAIANKEGIPFTIVNGLDDKPTKIGLIVAALDAIENEEIFVKDKTFEQSFRK